MVENATVREDATVTVRGGGAALTFNEIAQALGLSRGAVMFIYYRAMGKIRRREGAVEKLRQLVEWRNREGRR